MWAEDTPAGLTRPVPGLRHQRLSSMIVPRSKDSCRPLRPSRSSCWAFAPSAVGGSGARDVTSKSGTVEPSGADQRRVPSRGGPTDLSHHFAPTTSEARVC